MPANKNSLLRYKTIDNCLRNTARRTSGGCMRPWGGLKQILGFSGFFCVLFLDDRNIVPFVF